MSRPSILHFIETDIPGGAESMLIDLCRQQQRLGLRPLIGHFDHPYFEKMCREFGIDSFALPDRHKFKRMTTLPSFAYELSRRIRKHDVALVHSHLFGPIVGGALSAFLARVPSVGTLHDIHMVQEQPSRIRQLQAAVLLGCRLVTVSMQMQAFYHGRIPWGRRRITCIHNGIRAPDSSKAVIPEGLRHNAEDLMAIVVGRLVPLKRVQDALSAIKVSLRQVGMTLVVVGTGPELPALIEKAQVLGIADHVRFLGARNDVPSLLADADLFLQCSETEGLSMSIIEALHAGLPCIVTDVGGNPELVRPDYNGALYKVGDVDTLASRIDRLARDEQLRRFMGIRSKEIAQANFTIEACAESYRRLYEQCGLNCRVQ